MDITFIAITADTIGTLLIAWAALGVHIRVIKEHKIDKKVERAIKKEEIFFFLGIALVIAGYLLHIGFYS